MKKRDIIVYAAGLIQGMALVAFPAASKIVAKIINRNIELIL